MNGIDISAWQSGIDLLAVKFDFCFIKATEGTTYVNKHFKGWAQTVLGKKAKLGLYHFASGEDAEKEADYFLDNVKDYVDKAVLVLDFEKDLKPSWAKKFLERVSKKTGKTPILYTYYSMLGNLGSLKNYPLWLAAYPDNNPTGYKKPPEIKDLPYWKNVAIRQYSSNGRLDGYNGRLDLNYCEKWEFDTKTEGFGKADVEKLQKILGMQTIDGVLSSQRLLRYIPDVTSYDIGMHGSPTVVVLQRKLGVRVDGHLNPRTIKALQRVCATDVDGIWGAKTTAAVRAFMKLKKNRREMLFACERMLHATQKWTYDPHAVFNTYQKARKYKKLNCALVVSWAMQDAGLLPEGMRIWLGKTVHGSGRGYVEKHYTVTHPNKIITQKPGDIVGYEWDGNVHTMVYAGNGMFYSWGKTDVKLGYYRTKASYRKKSVRTLIEF